MRITITFTICVALCGALLAGCGGTSAPQTASLSGPFGLSARYRIAPGTHALAHPDQCCVQTLFISDAGANEVQLFKYPNGTYRGALPQPPPPNAAFFYPEGLCVDGTNPQHVFVTNHIPNVGVGVVDEYTHGGVFVTQLNVPGDDPISCAYRQTGTNSGVLATGNYHTIAVYANNNGVWGRRRSIRHPRLQRLASSPTRATRSISMEATRTISFSS